jgi:hypothetical protein
MKTGAGVGRRRRRAHGVRRPKEDGRSSRLSAAAARILGAVGGGYFFGAIASTGQTSTHAPQSVQTAASMTYWPSPSLIASTGHCEAHAPQLMHSLLIS